MRRFDSLSHAFLPIALFCSGSRAAGVDVLTYHNDKGRTGANLNEKILTPANVNSNTFGKLFAYNVDGYVYAQPLYVSDLMIPGQGSHNVVFVATEHNSIYAFDADSNTGTNGGLLWHVNLGPAAPTPSAGLPFQAIVPEVGITGTPVIASKTLYVNVFTQEGADYFHRIHALDITDGSQKPFSPVTVVASVSGVGAGSTNGVLTFQPRQQLQRSALTLAGSVLYVAYAGFEDTIQTDPYHGWLIGFSTANLQPLPDHVFNSTPNSTVPDFGDIAGRGAIWMGGSGPAVDGDNNLFLSTADGNFNAFNNSTGTEYGDSYLKFSTSGGLSVADYFTPYNQGFCRVNNLDIGAGGVMLLPNQPEPFPHLMAGSGKPGIVYLINRNMFTSENRHHNSSSAVDFVVQKVLLNGGAYSTPAYFDRRIFYAASGDVMTAFTLSNGSLSELPTSLGPRSFSFPGATPSVSANGDRDAIVWAVQRADPAILVAYDATDLSQELYHSSQAGARDQPASGVKFAVPTVATGKVYVGGQYALSVFGLLPVTPPGNSIPVGDYSGLFYEASGAAFLQSGSFKARITRRGTYTARLQIGPKQFGFHGQFDSSGSATNTVSRRGATSLSIVFHTDAADDSRLVGTVSEGTWVADLAAHRSQFKTRINPAPFAGRYAVLLPGQDGDPQVPQGHGYGAITVNPSGVAKFNGALADGTKLAQTATVSRDGQWPLYASLYQRQGQILGWLNFTGGADAPSGQLSWLRLPNSRAARFPDGFDVQRTVTGSSYQSPPVDFTDGLLTLSDGGLTSEITASVSRTGNNKFVGTNRTTLTLIPSSGLFKGSVANPREGKPIPFNGVILQNQNSGSGYFLGPNQSGSVDFRPQ